MSVHFNCLQMFLYNVWGVWHFEGLNQKNAKLRHVKMLPQTRHKILTYIFAKVVAQKLVWLKISHANSDLPAFWLYTVLIRYFGKWNEGPTNTLKTLNAMISRESEKGKIPHILLVDFVGLIMLCFFYKQIWFNTTQNLIKYTNLYILWLTFIKIFGIEMWKCYCYSLPFHRIHIVFQMNSLLVSFSFHFCGCRIQPKYQFNCKSIIQ